MFVKNQKGEELIGMIDKKSFHIENANTAFALQNNPNYYVCRTKDVYYDLFCKNLKEKGLRYAVNHYPFSPKIRIKRFLKRVISNSQ